MVNKIKGETKMKNLDELTIERLQDLNEIMDYCIAEVKEFTDKHVTDCGDDYQICRGRAEFAESIFNIIKNGGK